MKPALIILAFIFAALCGTDPPGCRELLDRGDVYYNNFNNGIAIKWYRRAYLQCPGDYEAIMKMARAYIDMGQEASTVRPDSFLVTGLGFAETLRLRFPDSSQAYFLTSVAAGNLYRILKSVHNAQLVRMVEYNAKKAITLSPDSPSPYIILGIYYREIAVANPLAKLAARLLLGGLPSGTLRDSERALQQAVKLSPDNIYALLELSRTNLLMGKRKEAIEHLKRSERSKPAWYMDGKLKEEGRLLLSSLNP